MTTITIDLDRCTGCGTCTGVCFYTIIGMDGEKPVIDPAKGQSCSRCGHCEAICPEGAIAVEYPGAGEGGEPGNVPLVTRRQVESLVKMRRSVRNYLPAPVTRKTIEEILEIVRYAPTGMNRQDVRWVVVHDPATVKECARLVIEWMREAYRTNPLHPLAPIFPLLVSLWDGGRDPICNGAPHLLVACSDGAGPIAFTDAVIALATFDLVAPAFGLGTCWAGLFAAGAQASPAIPELLGIPAGHRVEYGMMFGRPKYHFRRFPKRNPAAIEWA